MTQETGFSATAVRTYGVRGLTWRGNYDTFTDLAEEAERWMQQDWDSARTLHEERLAEELAEFPLTTDESDERTRLATELNRADAKNWAQLRWSLDGPETIVALQARESHETELYLTGTAEEVTDALRRAKAIPNSLDLRGRLDVTKRIRLQFDEYAGCSLEVSSADHDWGARTFQALERTMRDAQPGWRWLAGPMGLALRLAVTLMMLVLAVWATRTWFPAVDYGAIAYYLGLGLVVGLLVYFAFEWIAPRFLVTDHGRARVRLTVASVTASLMIGFLGGIIVSLLPL